MRRYRRKVTRIIWDFCKEPVAATQLKPIRVWFKDHYPKVGRVVVELIRGEGHIYVGFNQVKGYWLGDAHEIIDLLHDAGVLRSDNPLFGGIMHSLRHSPYNEVQLEIAPVNGEAFTLTAVKRCKTLFELLGMNIEERNCIPLVGNFTQESLRPTGPYTEFGTELWLEVFKGMPPARKIFSQES